MATKVKLKEIEDEEDEEEEEYAGNSLYETKEFLDKLDEYYSTYGTYKLTSKKLNEDFGTRITPETVSSLVKKYLSIRIGTEEDASKFFDNSFIRMQKRWEDSWEMIGDLVTEYKKMRKIIKERSGDDLTQALTFMKMSNQIISITSEIRKQLEFISKQQEEIKVYQQNNLIISPIQINQEVQRVLTTMTDEQIEEIRKSITKDRKTKLHGGKK